MRTILRPLARTMTSLQQAFSTRAASLPKLPLFEAIARHDPDSTAVIHSQSGRRFTYGQILPDVQRARDRFAANRPLAGERVAFLVENSYDYVVTLLAIFAARAVAVPLAPAFPAPELQYILAHSDAALLVSSARFADKAREAIDSQSSPAHVELQKHDAGKHEDVELHGDSDGAGLMLYTSGTTAKPKGVLLPHTALTAQSLSLITAWNYKPTDHLLHVLPLHHIHGVVNALLTPLFAGSSIEFSYPFNATATWTRFASSPPVTFFTAVPTVYSRLLTSHKSLTPELQGATRDAASKMLCISGSAALPTPVKTAWKDLSRGNVLLERYGMTEVGMALSCGLDYADRVDASVGWPLPGVEARLVDVDTGEVVDGEERAGEIQLRGETIFKEYFRNEAATKKEFAEDPAGRWFKTGDVAFRRTVPSAQKQAWTKGPMYFIQGRLSADIIKTGGEKVSALEVERELLSLPEVAEAAVVAVPSGNWGQKVGAVIVLEKEVAKWSPLEMRRALKPVLANYKIPQVLKVVGEIPRNAMGKINKKELVRHVFADEASGDEA